MALIWFRSEEDILSAMLLDSRAMDISVCPPRVLPEEFHPGDAAVAALIRAELAWVLLVNGDGGVRVNGFAPVAGVRVLQDRDEIRTALNGPLFFSAETLACVEEFPGSERAVYCGRCRQPMEKGQPGVRCPQAQCGIWYHQSDALPCWTYAPACAFCPQSTLDSGFEWIPEA